VANRSKVKHVELLSIGTLVAKQPWYNAGYIFPQGFSVLVEYKDIKDPDSKTPYLCEISEKAEKPWFKVAHQALELTFSGKSPTACWKQVLDMINETLKNKGRPVVRTQVAGPEYFGLNDPLIVGKIEELDPKRLCQNYWTEKENILKAREVYENLHPKKEKRPRKKRRNSSDLEVDLNNEENFRETYTGAWSTIQRKDRYLKRLETLGHEAVIQEDNPMPHYEDPITMQPVVVPALSPYGHVAGYYSWYQALKESSGFCPFTKMPLTVERLIKLTKQNWHLYKDFIKY